VVFGKSFYFNALLRVPRALFFYPFKNYSSFIHLSNTKNIDPPKKVACYARLKPLNRSGSAPLHLHWRVFKTLLHHQFKPPSNQKLQKTLKRQKKKSIAGLAGGGQTHPARIGFVLGFPIFRVVGSSRFLERMKSKGGVAELGIIGKR
jgi:hypothetical protein